MNEFFKKFFSGFIIAILILSSVLMLTPKKAQALVVFDPKVFAATLADTAKTIAQWIKEEVLRGVRDAVVHEILNQIADQVIQWVQGGGEPRFIGNWEDYLNQAYSQGKNEAVNEIPADYICPDFRDELQQTLGVSFPDMNSARPSQDEFTGKIQCTRRSENDNELSFLAPQDTYYGALDIIQNRMTEKGIVRAQAAQNEAIAGQGYLSAKKCLETNNVGECIREIITTPGQTIKDVVSRALTIDIDFMSNVQSPFSALVNALISRFIQKGLDQMGLSTSAGGTTISSSGSGWSEESSDAASQLKSQIINDTQNLLNHENNLLSIKKQSLDTANKIVENCLNHQDASEKVSSLTQEIATIQNIVNQLNFILNEARTATTPAELQTAQKDYNNFILQNQGLYENSITNDDINAAQEELQQLQNQYHWCIIRV